MSKFAKFLFIFILGLASACRSQANKSDLETDPLHDNAPPPANLTAENGGAESSSALLPADPMLVCHDDAGVQYWRFDANKQTWSQSPSGLLNSITFAIQGLHPLENNDGFLIYGNAIDDAGNARFQIFLWQDGQEKLVFAAEDRYAMLPQLSVFSSSGNELYAHQTDAPYTLFQINTANCQAGDCDFVMADEFLLRSPQGGKDLIWDFADWTIQIKDRQGENEGKVDIGGMPFWLSENRAGYLRSTDGPPALGGTHAELVIWQLDDESGPRVALDSEKAKGALIEQGYGSNPDDLILINARGNASHPEIVLVSATDPNRPARAILLVINLQTDQISYVPGLTSASLHQLEISPDGHFLVVAASDEMQLYAFETGETVRFPWSKQTTNWDQARSHAFSTAGEWLLLPSGTTAFVAQPGTGAAQEFNLVGQICAFGVWLNTPGNHLR